MPYIEAERRKAFDRSINGLIKEFGIGLEFEPGDLNYCMSRIIWEVWERDRQYVTGNELIGVLECVKQEFYRRMLGPYEDEKRADNGDIV